MKTVAAALLIALPGALLAPLAGAQSNTAPTRSFTTEWTCDNGRKLLINAHPRRPREEAHLSYVGNRVEVRLQGPVAEGRYASADGKVVWQVDPTDRNRGQLSYAGLLPQPMSCTRNDPTPTKK
jgi:hypothetical protein